MAMPLSVLGNAMSQTWADRHRIVLITQTRRKLKNLGYTAEHMPKLFLGHFGASCISDFQLLLELL